MRKRIASWIVCWIFVSALAFSEPLLAHGLHFRSAEESGSHREAHIADHKFLQSASKKTSERIAQKYEEIAIPIPECRLFASALTR